MIIAVEGPSYSGKTSVIEALKAHPLAQSALLFPCYVEELKPHHVPPIDPGCTDAQVAAFARFMLVEASRVIRTRAHARSVGDEVLVVLDRSVDTLLAHARALDRLYGYRSEPHVQAALLDMPFLRPDLTFYLDTPVGELTARRARSCAIGPYALHDEDFLRHTREYFSGEAPISPHIESIDGSASPEAVAGKITEILTRFWGRS